MLLEYDLYVRVRACVRVYVCVLSIYHTHTIEQGGHNDKYDMYIYYMD